MTSNMTHSNEADACGQNAGANCRTDKTGWGIVRKKYVKVQRGFMALT